MKKLRENLLNQPTFLIQESLDFIEVAWKILKEMYGDSERGLQYYLCIFPPTTYDSQRKY